MVIAKGQAMKEKCRALQAECMGKAEGEKDTCWTAKMKMMRQEEEGKFCENLPTDMIQKCKNAKAKCMGKSEDEKADCWDAMQEELREKMKANFCERVPA